MSEGTELLRVSVCGYTVMQALLRDLPSAMFISDEEEGPQGGEAGRLASVILSTSSMSSKQRVKRKTAGQMLANDVSASVYVLRVSDLRAIAPGNSACIPSMTSRSMLRFAFARHCAPCP